MMSRHMNGLLLLAVVIMMTAGCNGGGVSEGPNSIDSVSIVSPNDVDDTSTDINTVHNPEPASMALMGLGLAALLRRRRSQK